VLRLTGDHAYRSTGTNGNGRITGLGGIAAQVGQNAITGSNYKGNMLIYP
jgi:hypothetical protein